MPFLERREAFALEVVSRALIPQDGRRTKREI